MITLRPYQKDAINTIEQYFQEHSRQYIEMPTGAGKTVTFLSYAHKFHKKILIIVPSKELLKQVYKSSLLLYEPSQISRKGGGHNEKISDSSTSKFSVHICIVNSIRGKYLDYLSLIKFDLIIIDEAHHSQAYSYRNFLHKNLEANEDQKVLGVTATPERMDGQLLNEILHTCSFKIKIEELIQQEFLSDIEGLAVKTRIDISGLKTNNGDFSSRDLYKLLGTDSRNKIVLDCYRHEMKNRKTLVFCLNIDHSRELDKLFNQYGIASRHIYGRMKLEQRNSILSAFRNGEIKVLFNCQLLTEGFDEPSIDGIILARPTQSKALFMQMIGRGLRICPGKKNCKIIDIVDNHKSLCGFNSCFTDFRCEELSSFKSHKDLLSNIKNKIEEACEIKIYKTNLLGLTEIEDQLPVPSMFNYFNNKNIPYDENTTFDEASFLIWKDKLKEKYYGKHI